MDKKTKIAHLKDQIARYQDKCGRQSAEIERLKRENDNALRCVEHANLTLNATLIAVAIAHGERVQDEDKPDVFLGYRLTLPENMTELAEKYEVHARKDEKTNEIVVAVGLRDDPNDHKRDSE